MLRSKDETIRVEKIDIFEGLSCQGLDLKHAGMLDIEEGTIVALKDRKRDSYIFNTSMNTVLTEDHLIIAMGDIDIIRSVTEKAKLGN